MTKTLAARSVIQAELKKLCSNVHFEQANSDAAFPYLVYSLEELTHEYGLTLCQLEVNAVDYGTSTSTCETLADNVQLALDRLLHIDSDVQFNIYRERRQPVSEEDRKIIRRRMTFEVRLHERG